MFLHPILGKSHRLPRSLTPALTPGSSHTLHLLKRSSIYSDQLTGTVVLCQNGESDHLVARGQGEGEEGGADIRVDEQDRYCDGSTGIQGQAGRFEVSRGWSRGRRRMLSVRSWTYAGAEGALVFCADKQRQGLWFRIVDLSVSSRVEAPIESSARYSFVLSPG